MRVFEGRAIDDPEIETPAVLVELDALERNLDRMADRARRAEVNLRPAELLRPLGRRRPRDSRISPLNQRRGASGELAYSLVFADLAQR